jgi:hypothetical protein
MFGRHSKSLAGFGRFVPASIAWCLLLVAGISRANDPFCSLSGDQSILLMIQQFDQLTELLPPIPKEQEQAMAKQESMGLTLGLDARDPDGAGKAFHDLDSNPYYLERSERNALKRARAAVSIILVDAKSLRADKYLGVGFPSRFYEEEYADSNAVKLDHAGFAIGPVAAMELAIAEYLMADKKLARPKLPDVTRGEIQALASGHTASLGHYMQCRLRDVSTTQQRHQGANAGASNVQ